MASEGPCDGNGGSDDNAGYALPVTIKDKVSRNKRKFRADPPLPDLNVPPPVQTNRSGYDFFPIDDPPEETNIEQQPGVCDLCRTVAYDPEKEVELNEFQDADWSYLSESQLEELLLSNLDTMYKGVIKRIASYGYTEGAATNAILSLDLRYGCKDVVSNIVDSALAYLRNGTEVDSSLKESFSEDLRRLERSVLTDMVNDLRDVRPFFSAGDAMWCLLISDMNVSNACAMDDPLGGICGNGGASVPATANSPVVPEFGSLTIGKPNGSFPHPQIDLNEVVSVTNKIKELSVTSSDGMIEKFSAVSVSHHPSVKLTVQRNATNLVAKFNAGEENVAPSPCSSKESSSNLVASHNGLPEQKLACGRKGAHVGNARRDSIPRQKSLHFEKSCRVFGTKAVSKAAKHGGLGSLLLDKKCKPLSVSNGVNLRATTLKIGKAPGTNKSHVDATLSLSFSQGTSAISGSSYSVGGGGNPTVLPVADAELSLSLPTANTSGTFPKPHFNFEAVSLSNYDSYLSSNVCGHWVPQDKKDEMLMKLVPRLRDLRTQLQDWTDWAQRKIMQVTHRLSKDKAELQKLRQEKEEVASLRREKQALEESTSKKLLELENVLSKESGQVEKANSDMHSLEVENSLLRREMEAVKVRAAESAANLEELLLREKKIRKELQSGEKQKACLQEELTSGKSKLVLLQKQLELEKKLLVKVEAKREQEERAKDEAVAQATSLRKEREQMEASGKSKDDALKLQALNDSQRHAGDVQRLERHLAQLRLMSGSLKAASPKWAAALDLHGGRNNAVELEDDVPRERECVMCLTEQVRVVFLPCGHQVLCRQCNEVHEGKGLQSCPSCRSPVQKGIQVLFFGDS